MSVQLDLFKQNCDNAASMLLMFEKALPLDKSTCAHKLKDLPIPRGLESEWIFIVDVWMAFYHQLSVDLSVIDTPPSFADFSSSKILRHSDDVRTFISDLKNHIKPAKIDSLNSSYSVEMLSNAELKDKFRSACDKAASLLDDIETLSSSEKKKREVQLSKVSYPDLLSSSWAVIEDIWKSFVYQGYVDTKKLQHPSNLKIKHTPYPIRGCDGVKILIRSIGDYITIPKDSILTMTGNKNMKQSPFRSIEKVAKKPLLKKSSGKDIKDVVQNKYIDLINCVISSANIIKSLRGNNSTFEKIQRAFFERLERLLSLAETEMTHTLQHTVWDNLVVAFFGETNAGKSTIIETFRVLHDEHRKKLLSTDSGSNDVVRIVGDGHADFTKVYEEYQMQINGKPFTLIDVPGIEGKEEDFIDDIKKALAQAHLVFYVQGHNIKPNVATASKIKKYLGDWVNVYSVYNVRGGAFNYRKESQRENLISGDAIQAEALIKESFPEILGDVYKGNISLQALLALCAVTHFPSNWNDLNDIQTKVMNQFGTAEKLMEFSHFRDITKLISQKAVNFNEEIVEANKQKLLSLCRFFVNSISAEMDAQSSNMDKFSEELKTYNRELSIIFSDTKISLKNRLLSKNDILFSALQQNINESIDSNRTNSDIEKDIDVLCNTFTSQYSCIMTSIVKEEFNRMSEKLQKKQKSLDCYESLIENVYPDNIFPALDIDLSEAFAEMSISLGGVLSTVAGAVIGAGIGALFGGVGAIPGALIGSGLDLVRKSVFGDGGKSKAKEKVKDEIRKAKDKSKTILFDVCSSVNDCLSKETADTSSKIKEDLSGLTTIKTTLSEVKKSLQNQMTEINTTAYGNI